MKIQNSYQKFIRIEPWLHVFIWVMVLFYPYLKYSEREGGYMMSFAHELNSLVFKMSISYLLYFWFFPKKHKKKYLFWVVLAFLTNTVLYQFTDGYFHSDMHYDLQHFFTNMLTYISFGIIFFTLYSVKNIYQQQVQLEALTREKKQVEMSALKAQINPHFLFNTLNTIYANALKKDEKTPELILKLSDSFRYLFQEGQQEFVSLKKEVQHLTDYIQLQQERLVDKVLVDFSMDIDDEQKQIAPLLLIPFVENTFKYTSVLKGEKHPIKITLTTNGNDLFFTCSNPFNSNTKVSMDPDWSESGIGVANVKDRLQLVYPENHDLRISETNSTYSVKLTIAL